MSTDANLARAFPAKGRKLHLGGVGGGAVAFIGQVHARGCRIVGRLSPGAGIRPRPGVGPRSQPYRLARDGAGSAARPDDIDAAAITVPNHLDLPVAMAFMDAGIDVICDKPLVNTLDDPTITVNDAFKPVVRYW
ncbi:MAG TPA: Gfo/Idh/MocA family oxidoreductase, partial [Paracoccus sp. (in: a-proteobacteria)]|nr:Gfo/Idh/MocA family oxidoreductase [Paracoccus sp. (in: a-proteobacteria)]